MIWPFSAVIARLVTRFEAERESAEEGTRRLDDGVLDQPALALTWASRDALEIGDYVEQMMTKTLKAVRDNDPGPLPEVSPRWTTASTGCSRR